MKNFKIVFTLFKETPGAIHYRVPVPEGSNATDFPSSDLYIRKTHFEGKRPPAAIELEVKGLG